MENYNQKQSEKDKLESEQLAGELLEESKKLLRGGKLTEADMLGRRAASIWDGLNNLRQKAAALIVVAVIRKELDNDTVSMECNLDALEAANEVNAYDVLAKIYNNLGSKFLYLKAYDRALYFFEKSLDAVGKIPAVEFEKRADLAGLIFILNLNLSDTYCRIGNFEKARHYYHIVKEQSTNPLCEDYVFTFKCFEGLLLWKVGDTDRAEALVDSIMAEVDETEYAIDYVESVHDFVELLKNMRDFERWEKALVIINEHVTPDRALQPRLDMTEMWIEFYKATGNNAKYREACSIFYELSKEKEALDFERQVDGLKLQVDNREAKKLNEQNGVLLYTDPLTGIGNRNKMLKDSKPIIADSAKNETNITVGLIDVDFFKECNDTYGHIEGDECLRKVASTISDAIGSDGNVYRFGGDEFLVLLSDVTEGRINEIGGMIKDRLTELRIPNEKSSAAPYVTVSQGYTKAVAEQGDTIEYLINLADRILYEVKRMGKNSFLYMRYNEVNEM